MGQSSHPEELTRLLVRYEQGDADAGERLLAALYGDLRRLAARQLAAERPDHTLQPTALIHEAWLRLTPGDGREIPSRGHFLALASRVMRTLLVDHARARKAAKRGGDRARISLDGEMEQVLERPSSGNGVAALDVLDLHEALERLEAVDAELARLVELRWFAGSTVDEAAEATGLSRRTVERRLRTGTAWLRRALGGEADA